MRLQPRVHTAYPERDGAQEYPAVRIRRAEFREIAGGNVPETGGPDGAAHDSGAGAYTSRGTGAHAAEDSRRCARDAGVPDGKTSADFVYEGRACGTSR